MSAKFAALICRGIKIGHQFSKGRITRRSAMDEILLRTTDAVCCSLCRLVMQKTGHHSLVFGVMQKRLGHTGNRIFRKPDKPSHREPVS